MSSAPNQDGPSKPADEAGSAVDNAQHVTGEGEGNPGPGRPTKRTAEVEGRIIDGLSRGVPLTIICDADDMPDPSNVWRWAQADETFSQSIARAREAGFDRIALDALAIADNTGHEDRDTIETKFGPIPNKEWIMRSKLRAEIRLKLLSKWDPKRYGDKITTEVSGPDGKAIEVVSPDVEARILAASQAAAGVKPPGSFRGEETVAEEDA